MNPLIAIAAQVFPAIISALAGDKGGAIATQVAKAVTDVTGAKTADDAKQKVAADPKVAADLAGQTGTNCARRAESCITTRYRRGCPRT